MKARIVAKGCGGAEIRGHGHEKFAKCDVVGNGFESIALAPDYRLTVVQSRFLRGVRRDIGVECAARKIRRIKAAARRHRLRADEGFVCRGLDRVAATINFEILAQHFVPRILAFGQREIKLQPFGIALAPEDAVEEAGGVHELIHHFLFARGEILRVERNFDGFEFCELLGKVGRDNQFG